MKGYFNKIILVTLVVIAFVVSFNTKLDFDLQKNFRTIANSEKRENSCTTGSGTVYYVNTNINIRSGAGTENASIGSLNKCTQVKVYCTSNGWSRISKVSEKWVPSVYLSSSSTACSSLRTTTTDRISFGNVGVRYEAYGTSDNDKNQMYRDKPSTIIMTLNNINNVAVDDQNNIVVTVLSPNGTNVTNYFDITRTGVSNIRNGNATFTLKMKSGHIYDEGRYSVTFAYGAGSATGYFSLVGKYYNFTISGSKTDGFNGNPSNRLNTWEIALNDVEPSSTTADNFIVNILDERGNNRNNNYYINKTNRLITIKNKTSWFSKPSAGKYRVVITYSNPGYTTARSGYNQVYNFEIGSRYIEFEEKTNLRQSYRYERYREYVPYDMKIISKTSNTVTIKEKENGAYVQKVISQNDFTQTYEDFDSTKVTFWNNKPVIPFGAIKIISFKNNIYTYFDGTGNKNDDPTVLETKYPGVTKAIGATDEINGNRIYTFAADGSVEYNVLGTKTLRKKRLLDENKQVLSVVGGQFNFYINYSYLADKDKKVNPIITRDDGKVMTESDGFRVIKKEFDPESTEETSNNELHLIIDYDNTLEEYTGGYTVTFPFEDTGEKFQFQFSMLDGVMDYYLQSVADGHLTNPNEAHLGTPPGNKRYEYYLGFYMMKSGLLMDHKTSSSMTYKVYTEQADCRDNSSYEACQNSLYFFRQKDYVVTFLNYKDGIITFNLTLDGVESESEIQMPIAEFAAKYSEAYELFNYYTFDETTGDLKGNTFDVKVKKIYTIFTEKEGEEISKTYIDYVDKSGKSHTKVPITEFSKNNDNSDYYGYVVLRYVTDENDEVINGRIRGSLREETDEEGNPIQGEDITDEFDFTIDPNEYNVDRTMTVLPKVEVPAGTYYVYVGFEGALGVGYLNNSDEPAISKEAYPEMWNRNIHMTTIKYADPVYDAEIEEPKISNVGDKTKTVYANIAGKLEFEITPKYIYNFDGFSYKVQKKNGDNWVDTDVSNTLFTSSSEFTSESSKITINIAPGKTTAGDYRLVLLYDNNGFHLKEERTYEFTVQPKYYGIVFNPADKIVFAQNYSETKNISATGYYISNSNKIGLQMLRRIDDSNAEALEWDKTNKQFTLKGEVLFKYEFVETPTGDPNVTNYSILLTNVKNVAKESEYELIATYKEDDYLISSSTLVFEVSGNKYLFKIGKEERPRVDGSEYIIERDAYIAYINRESFEDIKYTIEYWDERVMKYVDVSSPESTMRMFTISHSDYQVYNKAYDDDTYEYKTTLTIAVNPDLAPMESHGEFIIKMKYDKTEEAQFSSLDELFNWSANLKISGDFIDGDKTVKVDKFYLNVDNVRMDIELDTPHEDIPKYIITQSCLTGSCIPSVESHYNSRFNLIRNEKDHITLEYRNDLSDRELLKPGDYALVVYYNDNDKKIIKFNIGSEYVTINFDDVIMYSDITNDKTVPNLFKNKTGHIQIPVSILGIGYDKANVSITDRNGEGDYSYAFTYNSNKFRDEHILDIMYNPNSNIDSGDYNIMVYYENVDGETISDNVLVKLNKSYFNFELGEPTYSPNPPIANADPTGEIKYRVSTEDIPNLVYPSDGVEAHAEKNVFAKNTVITDSNDVDVTSRFTIEAVATSSPINFDLSLKYAKNNILPGTYKIKVDYTLHDYTITKESYFTITDYEKDITIKGVEIITSTDDGRIHNNVGGIFKINYESIYDISASDIIVNVVDSNNVNVTSEFDIVKHDNYINVGLVPKTPPIKYGNYTINIIYTDPNTGRVSTHSETVKIYGEYKKILINNIEASSPTIYSDLENQYYTFNLDLSNISSEELSNMHVRVYDSYENIVYSSITSDKVTNIFDIVKGDSTSGQYRINILAFKAPVGEYQVQLLLPSEDGEYNISNRLTFTIDKNKYQIKLSPDSKVTPSNIYNNDASAFYDIDEAIVDYKFTSSYKEDDATYSIKVIKKGKLIKEITDINLGTKEEFGISYLTSKLEIDSLSPGEYDIDICLKGLPYDGITINVYEYIPITNFDVTVNNMIITGNLSTTAGSTTNFNYYIEPTNATNKEINVTSSDESILTISNKSMTAVAKGSAKLIFDHPDIHKEITVTISDRLTSDQFVIDYNEKTIFVNKLTTTTFKRKMLVDHLRGLSSDYQVLNKNSNVITDNEALIGTNSKVISGGVTYTVIVIGDLNGDGSIGFGDVSYLYDIYTGYTTSNEIVKKAGRIRKTSDITFGDVNKLFDFYRGIINEI